MLNFWSLVLVTIKLPNEALIFITKNPNLMKIDIDNNLAAKKTVIKFNDKLWSRKNRQNNYQYYNGNKSLSTNHRFRGDILMIY